MRSKNNTVSYILKLILTILFTHSLFGQQQEQYTQYMYNPAGINPAYAGGRGALSIFALYRNQWVGLQGAPNTGVFSANTPIQDTNLGVGISIVNDKVGPINSSTVSTDLSYTIPTGPEFELSFGVKGSLNFFNLDLNSLTPEQQNDPLLQDLNTKISPNVGAGIYWHSDKTYISFSIPNLIETVNYSKEEIPIYKSRMSYYLMGGYILNLDQFEEIKFEPMLLVNMTKGAPLLVDISANFMFYEKFSIGTAYRWNASVGLLAGFQVTERLHAGYAYDYETTKLSKYNSGSHEVFLRYEYKIKKHCRCPKIN